jgi:hypothetical protein
MVDSSLFDILIRDNGCDFPFYLFKNMIFGMGFLCPSIANSLLGECSSSARVWQHQTREDFCALIYEKSAQNHPYSKKKGGVLLTYVYDN